MSDFMIVNCIVLKSALLEMNRKFYISVDKLCLLVHASTVFTSECPLLESDSGDQLCDLLLSVN